MKTIGASLLSHLSGELLTVCTVWRAALTNGTVIGFTDHDADIVFNDGRGAVTYQASSGYTRSAIQNTGDLGVDNMEVTGFLSSPSITESDMQAGRWDYARIDVYRVNWADLTMGYVYLRTGYIGRISQHRGTFSAEHRGLQQLLVQTIGEIHQPTCRATLGDARCKVVMTPFTVTGTVSSVQDNRIVNDSGRAEASPPNSVSITAITNAAQAKVTTGAPHLRAVGDQVSFGAVGGMKALNGLVTNIVSVQSTTQYTVGINTTDTTKFPAFTSGGVAYPTTDAGYFDGGVMTWTGGANSGLSFDVKSYVASQFILAIAPPFAIVAGDTYTMKAGCNHIRSTCVNKFNNIINFRGEPDLPGLDRLVKVATI